uniref:Uncharacterized protein n=1 Tax=viral metagenome TaxID=1070528 RepID=A0A6C0B4J2_9ZZZZ
MLFQLLGEFVHFFIAMVYFFKEKLGESSYQILGGLYLFLFTIGMLQFSWRESSGDEDE